MRKLITIITAIATAFLLQSCKQKDEKYIYFSGELRSQKPNGTYIYLETSYGSKLNKTPLKEGDTVVYVTIAYRYQDGLHNLTLPEGITTLVVNGSIRTWDRMNVKFPKTMKQITFTRSFRSYDTIAIKNLNYYDDFFNDEDRYYLDTTKIEVRNGYKYEIAKWKNKYRSDDSITLIVENMKGKFVAPVAYDTTEREEWYGERYGGRTVVEHTFIDKIRIGRGVTELIVPDTIRGSEPLYEGDPVWEDVPPITIIGDSSDVETLILGKNCRIEGSFPKLKRLDGGTYTYEQYKDMIKLRE